MSKDEITTTLYRATRLNNSVNGNPRFALHTSHGDFITSSDAACSYEITNYSNQAPIDVSLMLTRADQVYGIDYAKYQDAES